MYPLDNCTLHRAANGWIVSVSKRPRLRPLQSFDKTMFREGIGIIKDVLKGGDPVLEQIQRDNEEPTPPVAPPMPKPVTPPISVFEHLADALEFMRITLTTELEEYEEDYERPYEIHA